MMENEAWPTPQTPSREPLPRVEDLPVAEQGYEQESVKAAFDSFYRHAAQLDAALRTLEAVDSFHRHASALRSDLRALRSAGWTQQSWSGAPPSYGYGLRAPREGVSPVVWRVAGEVAFLIAVAVALGLANLSWWTILLAMAGALLIVCAIEWVAGREETSFARPAPVAPVHPVLEAQRTEDTEEHDALGWTAFEEAQEPSDAMTIIGAVPRGRRGARRRSDARCAGGRAGGRARAGAPAGGGGGAGGRAGRTAALVASARRRGGAGAGTRAAPTCACSRAASETIRGSKASTLRSPPKRKRLATTRRRS